MFTNNNRQEERTGKYGTPRLQYLERLVSQFQTATDEETKEKIVANLANFSYDPYSFGFLRQLNVLELFLDCITEPNEKHVEFGVGGVCNSCVDPENAAILIQCGGIPLIIQCLSSSVRNTVNYALGALYYLYGSADQKEILKPEVIDVIKRYAAAEMASCRSCYSYGESSVARGAKMEEFTKTIGEHEQIENSKDLRSLVEAMNMIEPSYIQEGDIWGVAGGIDSFRADSPLFIYDDASTGGSVLFKCQHQEALQIGLSVDECMIDDLRFDMVFPQVEVTTGLLTGLGEKEGRIREEVSVSSEKNMNPSPLASLELLNEFSRGFRRLRSDQSNVQPGTHQPCTEVVCSKLSTEEIMRMAGARFIQSSASETASTPNNLYDLSFSDLSEEEAKDVQLAEFLLASAEKVGEKQYERASRLLDHCDSLTSSTGNPVRRVAYYFCKVLRGHIDRETGKMNTKGFEEEQWVDHDEVLMVPNLMIPALHEKIPFYQASHIAGVQAITENVAQAKRIHIIDLKIRNGIHLAMLMQALASRSGLPVELFKVSAVGTASKDLIKETGKRLSAFARAICIPFHFKFILLSSLAEIKEEHFELDDREAVVVYSEYAFATLCVQPSQMNSIMKVIQSMDPCIMVVIEVESDHNSSAFVSRFIETLFYASAYFDCIDTCMDKHDPSRMVLESVHIGERIGNLLAIVDGNDRIARRVKIDVWRTYFAQFGMVETELSATSLYQAEMVLKKFDCWKSCLFIKDGGSLLLGWKGRPLNSLSTWKFFSKKKRRS